MIANSKGQLLSKHSYAIARLSVELFELLKIKENSPGEKGIDGVDHFKRQVFLTGLLHDLGKLDESFQDYLNKQLKSKKQDMDPENGVHMIKPEKSPFSFTNYPRHNEISWALLLSAFDWKLSKESKVLNNLSANIFHGVYYHHENILREEVFTLPSILAKLHGQNVKDEVPPPNSDILSSISEFLKDLSVLAKSVSLGDSIYTQDIDTLHSMVVDFETYKQNKNWGTKPPSFLFDEICIKSPKDPSLEVFEVENEARRLLLRSLVISADRMISGLSIKDLDELITHSSYRSYAQSILKEEVSSSDNLSVHIEKMVESFSRKNEEKKEDKERDKQQNEAADNLSKIKTPATLFGPAGCGKTKIFLQWYQKATSEGGSRKKLIIIAPRKTVCLGLYEEIRTDYLPNASIELLLGDTKKRWINNHQIELNHDSKFFESDVVITTIDQITSIMMSHKKINILLDILNSVVVFDEFHEFFDIPGIVLLFKAMIYLKSLIHPSQTLLVSATPNYYFLKDVLKISKNSVVDVATFNHEEFEIKFTPYPVQKDPKIGFVPVVTSLDQPQKSGTFVIFNTATQSQKTSLQMSRQQQESVINFHSKFTYKDKKIILEKITDNWGKAAVTGQAHKAEFVLRAGPIVQASLNISSNLLLTEPCTAENWCQRLGRVNRFGLSGQVGVMDTILPDYFLSNQDNFGNHSVLKFLSNINSKNQAVSWAQYAHANIQNPTTLVKVYECYKDYHALQSTQNHYSLDFSGTLAASLRAFKANNFTPYLFPQSSKSKSTPSLSSVSLRGTSVFVLPIEWNEESLNANWLYVPSSLTTLNEVITLPKEDVTIRASHILSDHEKYIKNIKSPFLCYPNYKTQFTQYKIVKDARRPCTPVIVSFPTNPDAAKNLNSKDSYVYLRRNDVVVGLIKHDLSQEPSAHFTIPVVPPEPDKK